MSHKGIEVWLVVSFLYQLQVHCLLALLMLLALVLVVGEVKPQLVVVLNRQQFLLIEACLGEVIEVHKEVDVQIINHYETAITEEIPIIAVLIEELQPASIALVVYWCWGLHVGEGGFLLRVGVLRVVVVVVGGERLLGEWILHAVHCRLRVR